MLAFAVLIALFHGLIVIPTLIIGPFLFLRRSQPVVEGWFAANAIPTGYFFVRDAECPLTVWEQNLRRLAGADTYTGGFFQHYLGEIGITVPTTYVFDPIIALVAVGLVIVVFRLARRFIFINRHSSPSVR